VITNVVEAFEVEGVFLNLIFFFLLKIKKMFFSCFDVLCKKKIKMKKIILLYF